MAKEAAQTGDHGNRRQPLHADLAARSDQNIDAFAGLARAQARAASSTPPARPSDRVPKESAIQRRNRGSALGPRSRRAGAEGDGLDR